MSKDISTILEQLKNAGGSFSDCLAFFGVASVGSTHALKAKELHEEEGKIEIDSTTVVDTSDGGAYVMAWVWVGNN